MRAWKTTLRRKALAGLCVGGMMCQFGGCDIGQITTTQTLDGREIIISLVRGAILTPIDNYITNAINDAFGEDDD